MNNIDSNPQPKTSSKAALSDAGATRASLGLAAFALFGCGLLYSLASVGLGQTLFPSAANGSVVSRENVSVGSKLVAQPFADARYFYSRPSAAAYNPMALAGSNQARTNTAMRERIAAERLAVAQRENVDPMTVPSDLVTQSGGGIDPHISPASASLQIKRVANMRNLDRAQVEALVETHTEGKQFGLFGQPRVNVLELNLSLDALSEAWAQASSARAF